MKIIDKLSIENNLSISKIISILVEEALNVRGIFNKKTGKANQSYLTIKDSLEYFSKDSKANEKITRNNTIGNHKNTGKTSLIEQTNQDEFDLQTYKKFLSFLKFQEMIDDYKT